MRRIKPILRSKTVLWLAVLYSIAIIVLFLMPTSQLPSVGVSGIDKIVHIVIFFFLAIMWQLVVFKKRGDRLNVKMSFLLLGAMFIFGILIEVLQGEVTVSRTANFYDVLADLLGAGIGVLVFQKVKHLFPT